MNVIAKKPIADLGYDFIPKEFIPKGKTEYHLRDIQHRSNEKYRKLKPAEIKALQQNGNSSSDWNNIFVTSKFNAALIRNCSFFGLVRIGKLESCFVEFNNLRLPVGLYDSTIISCDLGDNIVIDHVNFLSHYIIGNETILVNIHEMATTNHSKFGNGVLKQGEKENVRIWMEICNENGGRSVLPFNGMQPGDAWLWSKYRDNEALLNKFREFTDDRFDTQRGYYGKVGERTVIKNCGIIKDVWIGSDAYIKGANKLKNLTINSGPEEQSQIGEGCELVNGIVGAGCRIFYGVKAVRFVMGSHSQLKYGARLINSYLGDNSTISCCEVLNSLIFPAHEQHHNNSFLCAALVGGQSNMAAGATIGSNHNSRGADGELIAGRGFWPGLCVSLKHNSKFASFTLIAKGDFPAELNIPLPFSLVSNDVHENKLIVMPGYWFMYNMYALARNAGKYVARDKRIEKLQYIEYDFLAPDSINEMLDSLSVLKIATAKAWLDKNKTSRRQPDLEQLGEQLLEKKKEQLHRLEIYADNFENSNRPVLLVRVLEAYALYKRLIVYHGVVQLVNYMSNKKITSFEKLLAHLPAEPAISNWKNIGGQLIPASEVESLLDDIVHNKVRSWNDVHDFYARKSDEYAHDKMTHAYAAMLYILRITPIQFTKKIFAGLLQDAIDMREWITANIVESRTKDYHNPFRLMVYDTEQEMEKVIGRLNDNSFIREDRVACENFRKQVTSIIKKLK